MSIDQHVLRGTLPRVTLTHAPRTHALLTRTRAMAMQRARPVLAAALMSTLVAGATGVAGAQISYSTQGFFSGPSAGAIPCTTTAGLSASCTGNAFTLAFSGASALGLASGTVTSLGTFALTGVPNQSTSIPPGSLFFTLLINQTSPTSGQGSFVGSISGSVTVLGQDFSDLVWTPNHTTTISPVIYSIILDNSGPAQSTGLGIPINNTRGIDARVTTTTTPEPSSIALLGTGLVGLVPAFRRRRTRG